MIDNLDYIYDIINEIKSTTKTSEKEKILYKHKNDNLLKLVLWMTYDYRLQYKVKSEQIDKINLKYKPLVPLNIKDVFRLLEKFSKKDGITKSDKEQLAIIINQMSDKTKNVIYKIIDKDLDCGIGIKTINKVFDDFIKEFELMLAEYPSKINDFLSKYDNIYWNYKYDGVRCLAEINVKTKEVILWSRDGRQYNLDFIKKELLKLTNIICKLYDNITSIKIDGELTYNKNDYEGLMTVIRRKDIKLEHLTKLKKIKYYIFDIILNNDYNVQLKHRVSILENLQKHTSYLHHIKFVKYNIYDKQKNDYNKLLQRALDKGYEGLVLKNMDSIYENKRSSSWVKVKKFETTDVIVNKIIEGNKKYKNMVGALECITSDNKIVNVGSGLTDEQRIEWHQNPEKIIGKTIEIKFMEKTGKNIPRHPIFVRIRGDMNEN